MIRVHVTDEVPTGAVALSEADDFVIGHDRGLTVFGKDRQVIAEFQPSAWTFLVNSEDEGGSKP